MLQTNSNTGKLPRTPNQIPASRVSTKARSNTKKTTLGVSNISVSIKSSKKTTDSAQKTALASIYTEMSTAEKGIQVNEVDLTAAANESEDGRNIMLPSARVLQEIERNNQLLKKQQLKAQLSETRKFEGHSAKQGVHLTNLKEFMERGAISRKKEPCAGDAELLENSLKSTSERTKSALEAYDRIKQKEHELIKMFNSI